MQTVKLIISLLLSILVIILIVANPWMVEQKYSLVFFDRQTIPMPIIVYMLISVIIGAVISAVSLFVGHLRLKSILREKNQKIQQMEEELCSLRNLPLRESDSLKSNKEMEIISKPL